MADVTILVGGKGDGSAAGDDHGGGFKTGYNATWANCQVADGQSLTVSVGATVTVDEGRTRLTKAGIGTGVVTGVLANCDFDAGIADGRYAVILVAGDGSWITVDATWDAGASTADVTVGGALATTTAVPALVTNGEATDVLVSQDMVIIAETTFSGVGGDLTSDKFLQIIGVDNTGAELTTGNYRVLDAGGANINGRILQFVVCGNNIRVKHIWAYNTDEAANSNGIEFQNTAADVRHIALVNCKASAVYGGFVFANYHIKDVIMIDCVGEDCAYRVLETSASLIIISNCYLDGTGQSQDTILHHDSSFSLTCLNTVFIGAKNAVQQDWLGQGNITCIGCVFYNQTVTGIWIGHQNLGLVAYNNIFMPAVGASDYGIYRPTRGSVIFADYNCYWSVDGQECQNYSGANGDHDLAVNPLFADAANGDFRLKPNSPLWNKGMPTPDGYSTMGAWGRINLIRES